VHGTNTIMIFLYFIALRLTLGANQPPGQSAAGFLSMAFSSQCVKVTSDLHLVPQLRIYSWYYLSLQHHPITIQTCFTAKGEFN